MSETAQLLTPGFSVADGEYPQFTLREGVLTLEFVDWQETPIRVRFANTAGVKWQELNSGGPEDRDDSVYEILSSAWRAQYLAEGAATEIDALRHFRLCFNALGILDVLATSMDRVDAGNRGNAP